MRKLAVIMAMAMVLAGAFAMSAQASITFDFFVNPPQPVATINYNGGNNPLTGAGISVVGVSVTGAPINNGNFTIANGTLAFTTGNFVTQDPLHWNFGGGGTIAFAGTVSGVDGFGPTGISFSGPIDRANVFQTNPLDTDHIVAADFHDLKSASFTTLWGLNPLGNAGFLNLSFTTAAAIGPDNNGAANPIHSNGVGSGDFTNVPVPPTLLLLGSGLLGLVGLRFRKN